MLAIDLHPGYFTISILGWNLYVDYGTCMDGRVLQVYTPDGTVIKHVYAYPSPPETVAGTGPDGETVTLTVVRASSGKSEQVKLVLSENSGESN